MNQLYALTLADRASEVLARSYNREAEAIQAVAEVVPASGCGCGGGGLEDMRVGINFESREIRGGLLAGKAGPELLKTLARSHHLEEDRAQDSADDLLAEFLNIVIGLAAADWAEKGLEIEFSSPEKASLIPVKNDEQICRLLLGGRPEHQLTLILFFRPQ